MMNISPILWFHSREAFLPESADNMIAQAEVWTAKEKISSLREEKDPVQALLQIEEKYKGQKIALKHTSLEGSLAAPLYYRVDKRDPQFIRVVFFLLFPFNGDLSICGTPSCRWISAGAHQGDLERFSLLLDPQTMKITKAYFGAHGSKDGLWKNGEDLEYEDGNPVIYCAYGSHALYPTAGTWYRYFGVANDVTEKGKKWQPECIEIEDDYPEWQKFSGALGWPDHSSLPRSHSAWDEDPIVSSNGWKRWFGC